MPLDWNYAKCEQKTFKSAQAVGRFTVFNVYGNKHDPYF